MNRPSSSQAGFTLVEVMVVIVIMSITASLVILNIEGINQRKAMQARELLILDLRKINREANDQSRIYALGVQNATDVAPFQYAVVEYKPSVIDKNNNIQVIQQNKWKAVSDYEPRTLPNKVTFMVEASDHSLQNSNNTDLTGANAPSLIWYGNGEAKPVRIQIYYDQKPVGDPINIDYMGKVDEQN